MKFNLGFPCYFHRGSLKKSKGNSMKIESRSKERNQLKFYEGNSFKQSSPKN